jgi:hypothetical protein
MACLKSCALQNAPTTFIFRAEGSLGIALEMAQSHHLRDEIES